jgi:hypothetical protein
MVRKHPPLKIPSILVLFTLLRPTAVLAGPLPCSVAMMSPVNGSTIHGTVQVVVSNVCPGVRVFDRLYVYPTSGGIGTTYDFGNGTFSWNTALLSNGNYTLFVIAWDPRGLRKEGEVSSGSGITIANGLPTPSPGFSASSSATPTARLTASRAPTPTATPTASCSASPTPSPGASRTAIAMATPTATTPNPTPTKSPLPAGPATVIKANDFLNSLGAVTHDIQGKESSKAIINGFIYTGLRMGRDDATHTIVSNGGGGSVQDLCNIHNATKNPMTNPLGVLYDELPVVDAGSPGNTNDANIADTKAEWDYLAACGAMLQGEGPNEPNNFPFYYEGAQCGANSSFSACAKYQQALYRMVKSDPALKNFPVLGISEIGAEPDDVGLQFLTIPTGAGTTMPAGTVFADVANAHNYVQGNGPAGTILIDNQARYAETIARIGPYAGLWDVYGEYWGQTWGKGFIGGSTGQNDRSKVTTETGWNIYSGGNLTYDEAGRLETDLYLDAYQLGWSETIIYKMFDEPPNDYGNGLFSSNGDEADAGNANAPGFYVHNLTTILSDNGSAFTTVPINVTVSNLPGTGYYQLIQKSTGTYELVLWGEAFGSGTATQVTVTLPNAYPTVDVYDITSGTVPVTTLTNVSSASLNLTDHALIVEFTPAEFHSR